MSSSNKKITNNIWPLEKYDPNYGPDNLMRHLSCISLSSIFKFLRQLIRGSLFVCYIKLCYSQCPQL